MSASAPKENSVTVTGSIPSLVGIWELEVGSDSDLPKKLTTIQITFQKHGETCDLIFGYVNSVPPNMSSYAIRDGQVTNNLEVFFVVRISGSDYIFNGFVYDEGQKMGAHPDEGDPGSWSAQAQSGG